MSMKSFMKSTDTSEKSMQIWTRQAELLRIIWIVYVMNLNARGKRESLSDLFFFQTFSKSLDNRIKEIIHHRSFICFDFHTAGKTGHNINIRI